MYVIEAPLGIMYNTKRSGVYSYHVLNNGQTEGFLTPRHEWSLFANTQIHVTCKCNINNLCHGHRSYVYSITITWKCPR